MRETPRQGQANYTMALYHSDTGTLATQLKQHVSTKNITLPQGWYCTTLDMLPFCGASGITQRSKYFPTVHLCNRLLDPAILLPCQVYF